VGHFFQGAGKRGGGFFFQNINQNKKKETGEIFFIYEPSKPKTCNYHMVKG